MRQAILSGFLIATLFGQKMFAQEHHSDSTRSSRWYLPQYVPVQFAGNIGFLSTGLGYTSNHDNYHLNLLYGYVPASVAKRDIHIITAKNIFPITRYPFRNNQIIIPYLGVGVTVEIGGNSFFRMPSNFPEGYYDFPKNVHVIAYGGAKLQYLLPENARLLRGMEFYGEAGTIDLYVWYKGISRQIKFNQILSLAFGVNFLLKCE